MKNWLRLLALVLMAGSVFMGCDTAGTEEGTEESGQATEESAE